MMTTECAVAGSEVLPQLRCSRYQDHIDKIATRLVSAIRRAALSNYSVRISSRCWIQQVVTAAMASESLGKAEAVGMSHDL